MSTRAARAPSARRMRRLPPSGSRTAYSHGGAAKGIRAAITRRSSQENGTEQRMVFAANTYREFAQILANSTEESEVRDPWVTKMWRSPATVVSTTLKEPLDWPDATVVSGDAVDVVAGLKEESDVPLRSHGSLSMNRALMAAGLVDHVQVTLFPVITGQTGLKAIFQGAQDFDLELVEHRTLDSHIQELIYRPTLH
jgi:dihydrofolate reductase